MSNITNINHQVARFLSWPLPKSVCADPCASNPDYPHRSGTNLLNADQARQMLEHVLGPRAQSAPVINHQVARFLSWPLPKSVCADPCASNPDYPHRSGTNLLNADQARQMLEHVLGPRAQSAPVHPDDLAVDLFAAAMKAKMAKQRAKGYGGWGNKDECPTERLQTMLAEHLGKGDPVDVGNFAMMLFARGESTALPAAQPAPLGTAYLCEKCQTPFDGAYYCPSCGHNTATKEYVYAASPTQKGSSA